MTQDDIIRMVQAVRWTNWNRLDLIRFAALVAAAEREACAKVCDDIGGAEAWDCAAAIRARGAND